MRIALYIEDGLEQVVLTPDSETERAILAKLDDGSRKLAIRHGQFFRCAGGFVHQQQGPRSTMIVLTPPVRREPDFSEIAERVTIASQIKDAVKLAPMPPTNGVAVDWDWVDALRARLAEAAEKEALIRLAPENKKPGSA